MANMDPAFKTVNPTTPGFYIWRIEEMMVVPVPKKKYGEFYKGDSYIVLSIRDTKGPIDSHIHFWLGKETSQDEAGVAAYKSVELDDCLGGFPVQHREVQDSESRAFLSYFKNGIRYMAGGVKSGFNHVEHTFKKRLLHIKGKHHVRVSETDMSWSSMNSGDVFILDVGQVLFVWNGKDSSRTERIKGLEQARHYRDERKKVNIVSVDDGEENKMLPEEIKLWDSCLSLSERHVASAAEGGADEVVERARAGAIKLYRCTEDQEGTLKVSEVKNGPLVKGDLDSIDSFIIDNGALGIWAWIGKGSTKKEKSDATRNALGFISKKKLPNNTNVTRVVEGGEPADFKCLFKSWPVPQATGKAYNKNRIAKTVQTKFDASTLHSNRALAAETQMVDDGSGNCEIWRVEDFALVPIEKKFIGQFFGGDCYVILYTYKVNGRESYIIYYWQGQKSSSDEKGTSALKAVELDEKYGGAPVQVRVVQGKEPQHFMAMFDGKMIVFSGGKAGWSGGSDTDGPGDSYMLQVRGTSILNTKAVQVPLSAESLNSNDVFVIFAKRVVYAWYGKGSTGDEREAGKNFVRDRSTKQETVIVEGQEPQAFWDVLGGKAEYASSKRLQDEESNRPVRLFQVSNASGIFAVDEIPEFTQEDCVSDDCMILDASEAVYVWIGANSRDDEKKKAEQIAMEYVKTDPADRDPDTPVYKIKQGHEPPTFTGFFGVWDREFWENSLSYEQLSEQLRADNESVVLVKETEANGEMGFDETTKYPLAQLQGPSEDLPADVDGKCREIYMTTDDFQNTFGMNYTSFMTKPVWKQQEMKKKNRLF